MDYLPKISVIIPVLNGEKTLDKAIQSVTDQDYDKTELIILDGGSTDGTLDIIKKHHASIIYWHSKPDGNPSLAVLEGIKRMTGDIFIMLMDDDFFEPDTFQKVAHAYQNQPDTDIISVGGRILYFDSTKNTYHTKTSYQGHDLELSFHNICFGASAICCRFISKLLIDKIGFIIPADSKGKHIYSADKEFLLRAARYGVKHVILDHIGHNYLSHEGSTTFSNNRRVTVRMYAEHMQFALAYLRDKTLTYEQHKTMRYLYTHQSARLAFYHFYKGQIKEGLCVAREGLQFNAVGWLVQFAVAPFTFIARRLWQYLATFLQQKTGWNTVNVN